MTALVALAAIVTLGGLTAWAFWLARRPHPELLHEGPTPNSCAPSTTCAPNYAPQGKTCNDRHGDLYRPQ